MNTIKGIKTTIKEKLLLSTKYIPLLEAKENERTRVSHSDKQRQGDKKGKRNPPPTFHSPRVSKFQN
jgi:hypothetical protein